MLNCTKLYRHTEITDNRSLIVNLSLQFLQSLLPLQSPFSVYVLWVKLACFLSDYVLQSCGYIPLTPCKSVESSGNFLV